MLRTHKLRVPVSMYVQMITFIIQALLLSRLAFLSMDGLLFLIVVNSVVILMLIIVSMILLIKILKKNNTLELTSNMIKLNNTEVEIQAIEKIIIQGYFVQSIGIKLYGKKYVKNDLHFRFKYDEEKNIEELKQWAAINGINVTGGRIYRWV